MDSDERADTPLPTAQFAAWYASTTDFATDARAAASQRVTRTGIRMSTALTYLAPDPAPAQPQIRPDTLVDRVLLNSSG